MSTERWTPSVVLVTCEHGGNEVPPEYAPLFRDADAVLASHRGWDPGALGYGLRMATRLSVPLMASTVTRLLVELNRSPDHPDLFSRYTRGLVGNARRRVIERFYLPHRSGVEGFVRRAVDAGERVLHLGAHSFTDVLDGAERAVDVGLLFDPDRACERGVCRGWGETLRAARPGWLVRDNEPYLGTDDGLTTYLRTRFPDGAYAGVEIEVRQGLLGSAEQQIGVGDVLSDTLRAAIAE